MSDKHYPLSYSQQALLFLHQTAPATGLYNICLAFRITSPVDADALKAVWSRLVNRHGLLRATFPTVDGEPVCRIRPRGDSVNFEVIDVSSLNTDEIRRTVKEHYLLPFALEDEAPYRVRLFRRAPEDAVLLLTTHHIISDGLSLLNLTSEMMLSYANETGFYEEPKPLPALKNDYSDFVSYQRELLAGPRGEELQNYWKDDLSGELPLLDLPTERPRSAVRTPSGGSHSIRLSVELTRQLRAFCKREGATPGEVLLAAYKVLLYRYTGQRDIVVGVPALGRKKSGFLRVVGDFTNTVAVRSAVEGDPSFREFLGRVSGKARAAMAHQEYPFSLVIERLCPRRETGRPPIIQTMFAVQSLRHNEKIQALLVPDGEHASCVWNNLTLEPFELTQQEGEHEFALEMWEGKEDFLCIFKYHADLFDASTIRQAAEHYRTLLDALMAEPELGIGRHRILSEAERNKLLSLNVRGEHDGAHETVIGLFEKQARLTPENVALIVGDGRLTYRRLDEQAERLAHYLRESCGVRRGAIVALLLERSEKMLVAILAVLKAGAAYLPIAPTSPAERLLYLLDDSGAKHLLADQPPRADVPRGILQIDVRDELLYAQPVAPNNPAARPDDTAYVIYTSGTTGRPKGCRVTHKNVVALFGNSRPLFGFDHRDVWIMAHSYTFDFSVWEMYGALFYGGALVVPSHDEVRDVAKLRSLVHRHGVTILNQTPGAFYNFVGEELRRHPESDDELSLRCVIFGGDKLETSQLAGWARRYPLERVRLVNMYGITETTVHVTYYAITAEDIQRGGSPVGRALPGVELYVLDGRRELVPRGVAGELYVGGVGVSKGYLNRPELTAERFIQSPFDPDEVLYKTGDLGRWRSDDTLEYMGRNDEQVKVRGFRIELGEIENVLLGHPSVKEAVVLARTEAQGGQYLAAYFAAREVGDGAGDSPTPAELRAYLKTKIPDYMIPSYFVRVDKLPLTSNNKIDKKSLPEPEQATQTGADFVAPRTPLELKLAAIWRAVLGREQVGLTDNFFEIGGHSLKATRLVAQIHKELGVKVELLDLFAGGRLADLARLIEGKQASGHEAIKPLGPQPDYAVSRAQKRMWVLSQLSESSVAYNISVAYRLEGELDVAAFAWALDEVVARHESLRTVFVEDGDALRQVIRGARDGGFGLDVIDLGNEANVDETIRALVEAEANTPFVLSSGPLLRAKLIRLGEGEMLFLFTMHHIISDGWSMEVLVREVWALYDARRLSRANPLAPLPIQYKDYAAWQNELLERDAYKAHREYWLGEIGPNPPALDLPTDKPRPKMKTFRGDRVSFEFDGPTTEALRGFCNAGGYTLFQVLFAGVNVLLHRYTGQTSLLVGLPVAGRIHADLTDQIGFYVNTLAVKTDLRPQDTLSRVLGEVKEKTLRAFEHQAYPFDQLIEDLDLAHDMSRSTLFDVMVVLQNTGIDVGKSFRDRNLTFAQLKSAHMVSRFDLMFEFAEAGDGLQLSVEYNTDLFERARIERAAAHLANVLRAMLEDDAQLVGEVSILSAGERRQLVEAFNQTAADFPAGKTMQELFEEWARRTPDAAAVRIEDRTLTYGELNEKSNRLAHYLRDKFSLKPNDLVGMMLERSERMIVGQQAILKAGAAYVPIDPAYPKDRIRYMLENASVKTLLVDDRACGAGFGAPESVLVSFDEDWGIIEGYCAENPRNVNRPDDLAYVIYTSGSTGRPKGVMIEHRNAVNMSFDQKARFRTGEKDKVLQFASISFDQSVFETCMALHKGATLVLTPRKVLADPQAFADYLTAQEVSLTILPPAFLSTIELDRLRGLRVLLTGGEQANAAQLLHCREFTDCYNAYGPTECGVYTSAHLVTDADRGRDNIPIGGPTSNTQFYILDDRMNPQPIGVPGELYIGGANVGRGYLNRPDLTAERFVPNPFAGGGRLYKTGDLGRWLPDKIVEYLGRKDEQIKVRGFRIEPGEIEHALFTHEKINEAAVVARQDAGGHKYLVAYIAASEPLAAPAVKAYLQSRLPDYMVPPFVVQLESLPLTPSAKVDKKALPAVGEFIDGGEYRAPRTQLERRLVAVWESLLGRRPIGIGDNFFDLGGQSLRGMQLISRLQKDLQVQVGFKDVFLNPTVELLAEEVSRLKRAEHRPIEPVAERDFYPLSHAQHSIWILSQSEDASVAYNMPGAFRIEGRLDRRAFEDAFQTVLSRHESLRTAFAVVEGEPRQRVHEAEGFEFAFDFLDLCESADAAERVEALLDGEAQTAFDLERGPLVRAKLLRLSPESHVFLFTAHHIVSDGWSMNVLVNEVITLYLAYRQGLENPLPPLRIQYKDYAEWQAGQLAGEAMRAQRDYWLSQFAEPVTALQLPTDFPRPPLKTYAGRKLSLQLDEAQDGQFFALCRRHEVSMFMLLLTSVNALLYHYTGQTDIVVGSPIAGRNQLDLEDQIGLYINTLALRTRFDGGESFERLLARVRESLLAAYENQSYPAEMLVEELSPARDLSRSPLFDVMVVFQNQGNALLDTSVLGDLAVSPYERTSVVCKFDLTFEFVETPSGVTLNLLYNCDLFEEATIHMMLEKFGLILRRIVDDPSSPLDSFDLTLEVEREFSRAESFMDFNL